MTVQSVVTVDFLSAQASLAILFWHFLINMNFQHHRTATHWVFVCSVWEVLDQQGLMKAGWWSWGKSCSWVWRSRHEWSWNTYQVAEVPAETSVNFEDAGGFAQTACIVEHVQSWKLEPNVFLCAPGWPAGKLSSLPVFSQHATAQCRTLAWTLW